MAELPPLHDPVTYIVTGPQDQRGPYTLELICSELIAGRLSQDMLIWWPGMTDWVKVKDHDGLQVELQRRRASQPNQNAPLPPPPAAQPSPAADPPHTEQPESSVSHDGAPTTVNPVAPGWASPQQVATPSPWSVSDLPVVDESPQTTVDARVVSEAAPLIAAPGNVSSPFNVDAVMEANALDDDAAASITADDNAAESIASDSRTFEESVAHTEQPTPDSATEAVEAEILDEDDDGTTGDDSDDDQVDDAEIIEHVVSAITEPEPATPERESVNAVATLIATTQDFYNQREHRAYIEFERQTALNSAAESLGWELKHDAMTLSQQKYAYEQSSGDATLRLTVSLERFPHRALTGDEDFSINATITGARGTAPTSAANAGEAVLQYGEIETSIDEWTGIPTHSLTLILGLAPYVVIDTESQAVTVNSTALQTDFGHIIDHLHHRVQQ